VTSVADSAKLLDDLPEIAFVGRSNVGKSSFINCLTNRNKLAKASSEPGRTRLINYFNINNGQCYFVDLPGYGFARVSDAEKERWSTLIERYLIDSKRLKNVFVILDIRHQPNELDKLMLTFLNHYRIGFTIIATKTDKINKSQIPKQVKMLADALCLTPAAIYPVSSHDKYGRDKVLLRIEELLSVDDAIAELQSADAPSGDE
jgi:GTP-binding protein